MVSTVAIRFDRAAFTRMIGAGSAWGITLAAGFFAIGFAQCGTLPCLDDAAFTTLVCVGTGLFTIGPLAAFSAQKKELLASRHSA